MAVFLLECREEEERQADYPSKKASLPVLETMARQWYHFNNNSMVSNNIIILFLQAF